MEELRVWLWRYYRLMDISFSIRHGSAGAAECPLNKIDIARMGQILAFLESVPEWRKPSGPAPDPLPVWPDKPEDIVL